MMTTALKLRLITLPLIILIAWTELVAQPAPQALKARYPDNRNGPKVFAGEYAAHTTLTSVPEKRNNWESALAEAAFHLL